MAAPARQSLRAALAASSKREAEAGALVRKSLGGVVWYERPAATPTAQRYAASPPRGAFAGRERPFGYAPRGAPRARAPPDVDDASAWTGEDAENDFVGQRAVRFATAHGGRSETLCRVDGRSDAADGACPDGVRRTYVCVDADDGTRHRLGAAACADAVARADEARRAAAEAARAAARSRDRAARDALEADARAAADAADAAIAAASATWRFDCSCGAHGLDYDDGEDMIECARCYAWAHDACVVDHLRGRGDRLGALRQGVYECRSCAPRRYERRALCDCAPDGGDLGDGEAWLQCAECGSWCHGDCVVSLDLESCPACRERAGRNVAPPPPGARRVATPRGFDVFVRRNGAARDATIVREVLGDGCYERPLMGFEVVPGETWLDVGAHVGTFSCRCLAGGADVVAVEPDPANFALLEANLELNAERGARFRASRAAVVADAEIATATLFRHPRGIAFRHSTERRLVSPHPDWPALDVPTTTLDALLDGVDGVKIDAQGAEVPAVESVTDWKSVRKLVLEYDFEYRPSLPRFHAFVEKLRATFPRIHHSKQKRTGSFTGFPNGVLVFAMRDLPA